MSDIKKDIEKESASKVEGVLATREATRVLSHVGLETEEDAIEAAARDGVSSAYEKKCALVNHIMQHEIGMGRYQWGLFVLSGFGWAADNLWLQGVAIILPQIKKELHPSHIEFTTFSLFMGLIFGASTWGILADVIGRKLSWNMTLFVAGVFGIAGGAAPNFPALGVLVAFLGFGVGGNLPVDGALFLEFVPATSQWLLTVLSLFWSLGQVYASVIAWAFIGNFSCDQDATECAKEDNMGWRYTFYTLGATTFLMWVCRFGIFNLQESPKYLLAKGRDEEALKVLQFVAQKNGKQISLTLEQLEAIGGEGQLEKTTTKGLATGDILKKYVGKFDLSHIKPLFANKKLGFNTSLVFLFWGLVGMAYPLYNAFLPTYLSNRNVSSGDGSVSTTYRDYTIISVCGVPGSFLACLFVEWRVVGRRYSMAAFTALSGVFCFLFMKTATTSSAILGYNCASGLTQNAMYGIIYAYTPEVFPAPHRGTGNAIASALNRLFGLMAPIVGMTADLTSNVPLYVSASLYFVAAGAMSLLPLETQGKAAL